MRFFAGSFLVSRLILPGGQLELAYPTHNRFDLNLEYIERTLTVLRVRDFSLMPMDARHLIKRPLVRRGRIGVEAIEEGYGERKCWWVEAQRGDDLPEYRLGLIDPKSPGELVDYVGRIYGATLHEQFRMRKAVMKFCRLVKGHELKLKLVAFPGFW
jgi:hypothetical protein